MKETAVKITYFLLRTVTGFLFLQAGGSKLFGWLNVMPPGMVLDTQTQIGAWMEVVGGTLIILGLFTHVTAFLLSGEMAVAYWQFHFKSDKFWPAQNGGIPAVLMCFIFLYLAARGGGPWSLDALLFKKKDPVPIPWNESL